MAHFGPFEEPSCTTYDVRNPAGGKGLLETFGLGAKDRLFIQNIIDTMIKDKK